MYGSHSATLMISVSTFLSEGMLSLTAVGKPAPPKPTSPLLRTAVIRSERLSTFGGAMSGDRRCSPSLSMKIASTLPPSGIVILSIFLTVPETLAWMGALTKASLPAIC